MAEGIWFRGLGVKGSGEGCECVVVCGCFWRTTERRLLQGASFRLFRVSMVSSRGIVCSSHEPGN